MRAEQKLRGEREAKAAELLRALIESTSRRHVATALDLGRAAMTGERRARSMPMRAKAAVGLSIGCELVRRGVATVTAGNMFRLSTLAVSS